MRKRLGFSLIELLTVISIMVLLIGILVPVLARARLYARSLVNIRNQRDIVTSVTLFACDHEQQFPASVALCEKTDRVSWRWQDPRKLRTTKPLQRMTHSSVAGYLNSYVEDVTRLSCPSIPQPYPFWQEAWEAGDTWDHPDTAGTQDPVFGSYCLYWNYVGYQDGGRFLGPKSLYRGPGESNLLVSDYFGYDEVRSPNAYGSCELLSGIDSREAKPDTLASSYWSYDLEAASSPEDMTIKLKLHAGFIDGHVKTYYPNETQAMKVADVPDGSRAYFKGGYDPRYPGEFFIPKTTQSR
jgi:prepilin-type N-terminal cleavage/methylation domain-containing protein